MSNLYCRRHQQSWPQGTEVKFGPRDEYGITRLPCCAEPSPDQFTVASNFRKAGPSAQAAQAAAESAKLNDTHRKIYRLLKGEPLTADEVADRLGMVLNTARARITDLHKAGWIFDTGERGETDARKPATIWAVSQRRAAA
jgi:DNA-directed RNA polymerase specialized sigma24 family protein